MKTQLIKTIVAASLALGFSSTAIANDTHTLIKSFYTAIDDSEPTSIEPLMEYFVDSFKDNDRSVHAPEGVSDKMIMANLFTELATGFPEAIHKIDMMESISKNRVMVYWTFTGKHTGEFFGAPATGNEININGIDIFRVVDGKFVEQWHIEELMDLFEQVKPKSN